MMRKLATVQLISELESIPNSDNLEVAKVLGWKCVVRKGEFKVGERVCYIEIDSVLPVRPEFEFLRKSCYVNNGVVTGFRIKTVRLRGQYSQGIILPLSILNGLKYPEDTRENPTYDFSEGKDLTALIGVEKFEKPIPAYMAGKVKGNFPGFIPKTDETRVQVLGELLTAYKGTRCYVTEKIDGSSTTFYLKDGEFGVCSRNLELAKDDVSYHEMPKNLTKLDNGKFQYLNDNGDLMGEPFDEVPKPSENIYWKMARQYGLDERLRFINRNLAIQGETYGEGLQGNPLKIKRQKFAIFNIYDIHNSRYLTLWEMQDIVKSMNEFIPFGSMPLEIVPVLNENFVLIDDIDELVIMAKIKSSLNPQASAEGIVIRPLIDVYNNNYSEVCKAGRISFKVISPEYLVANDE